VSKRSLCPDVEVVNLAAPPPIIIASKTLCSFSIFIDNSAVKATLSGFVYGTPSISTVGMILLPLLISSTLAAAHSFLSTSMNSKLIALSFKKLLALLPSGHQSAPNN
jgi:hypothetical protein